MFSPFTDLILKNMELFNNVCKDKTLNHKASLIADLVVACIPDHDFRTDMKQLKAELIKKHIDALPPKATDAEKLQTTITGCRALMGEILDRLPQERIKEDMLNT